MTACHAARRETFLGQDEDSPDLSGRLTMRAECAVDGKVDDNEQVFPPDEYTCKLQPRRFPHANHRGRVDGDTVWRPATSKP